MAALRGMFRFVAVAAPFALIVTLAPAPVSAAPPRPGAAPARPAPPLTPVQRETRRLMEEGKERTKAGEKERALESYRKAYELARSPVTGVALAKAHVAVGRLLEGRAIVLEVGRLPRESVEKPDVDKARKEANELDGTIKARIPTVQVVVKGGPATRVAVDGGEVASLLVNEPIAVNPGLHVVSATNADGTEKRVDVELAERDTKSVEIVLPVPEPALVVATLPPKPVVRPPPPPPVSQRTTGARVLMVGGFGLAAVGLAVGGVAGALTLSKSSTVKAQCENDICDPRAKNDLDSASTLATVSTIGFAVAGGGLVLGVVGMLLPKTKVESAAAWIGPSGLRGSF